MVLNFIFKYWFWMNSEIFSDCFSENIWFFDNIDWIIWIDSLDFSWEMSGVNNWLQLKSMDFIKSVSGRWIRFRCLFLINVAELHAAGVLRIYYFFHFLILSNILNLAFIRLLFFYFLFMSYFIILSLIYLIIIFLFLKFRNIDLIYFSILNFNIIRRNYYFLFLNIYMHVLRIIWCYKPI